MIFRETKLRGAFLIEPERFEDQRGFFALTWSQKIFAERGLESTQAECNISFSRERGTLRGMHYQVAPHGQVKLIRCTAGAVYDCIIDLRRSSPTYGDWVAEELTSENRLMLYVPIGFAHGFQTLRDESEVYYQMSAPYHPGSERGVRWNDPAFNIFWPQPVSIIAGRDKTFPDFADEP